MQRNPTMISKTTFRYFASALLLVGACILSACNPKSDERAQGKISIVAASYPEYDWLCQIIGDKAEQFSIKLLMNDGIDLHSYEPNIQDIAAINEADLFIYNGGSSYKWVPRVLKMKSKKERKDINLMESLGNQVLEVEGDACGHDHHSCCEHEHEHDCDHEHDAHCDHNHAQVHEDEHIWLSLRHAIQLCEVIEEAVSQLAPEQANQFEANKQSYIQQLQELDARYVAATSEPARDTVIIADRFPFIYLFSDYGLKHEAAFQGCSSETEASFETVSNLSQTVKALQPKIILTTKGGMKKLAQTIIHNSGQSQCQILELDDIHTAETRSYLDIMSDNLKVIEAVLAP